MEHVLQRSRELGVRKSKRKLPSVANGCTQLASAVGISVSHASLILRGCRTPSLPIALRIARYLKVTPDELQQHIDAVRQTQQQAA